MEDELQSKDGKSTVSLPHFVILFLFCNSVNSCIDLTKWDTLDKSLSEQENRT